MQVHTYKQQHQGITPKRNRTPTSFRSESLEGVPIPHRHQQKHQRTEVARTLKTLPRQIEPPYSEGAVAQPLPFHLRLKLGYGAHDPEGGVEVVEL